MRLEDTVWQGNFGYWQQGFIHSNLLMIGYYAWNGFLEMGRGMVSVEVDASAIAPQSTSLDVVQFSAHFVAKSQFISQMSTSQFDQDSIDSLIAVVDRYNPQQDVILLLTANQRTEITLLQNLKITPCECAQQVRRRWDEFQPCLRNY